MAQAMIHGMTNSEHAASYEIYVANRSDRSRLEAVAQAYAVEAVSSWRDAAQSADILILAIPPGAHPALLSELRAFVRSSQLVVSVAAGIGISGLASALPEGTPVAWVMPNTAAQVGQSMTLCTFGPTVSHRQQQELTDILDGLGRTFICSEQQTHELTAITGSAPAFIFSVAEALEQMALQCSVDEPAARMLVAQMLLGSAHLLIRGDSPSSLADEVTTPGGATAAGLEVLEHGKFASTIQAAITATNRRARELTGE